MKKKIAIFGAGITGLAAARHLARKGYEVDVYESSDRIGGLAKTFQDSDGFTYDNGPRFIFSTLAEKIGIQDICEPVAYYEFLYVGGEKYRFPFGFIRNPLYCLSMGWAMFTRPWKRKPKDLREFLYTYYGRLFSRSVLQPLIEKWAGIPAEQVSVDFASRLLPTNFAYIIYSLIKKLRGGVTEDFYKKGRYIVYPKGSNAKIFEALLSEENYRVHLRSPITKIETNGSQIQSAWSESHQIYADCFISTIPISRLSNLTDTKTKMKEWTQLQYRLIRILFIKLNQPNLIDGLWHWFPESKYPFYRISEYKNARSELAPADKTLISLEFGLDKNHPYVTLTDQELFEKIYPELEDLYNLKKENVLGLFSHVSETAYPILKKETESLQRGLDYRTEYSNLFIAGRTGMFQYKMTEGSYDSAVDCANLVDSFLRQDKISEVKKTYDFSDSYGRPNQIPE